MIKIYINNELIDIDDSVNVGIDLAINDLIDFTAKKATKTTSVKAPLTPKNKRILGYQDDIRITKQSYTYNNSRLEVGSFIFRGYAKLQGITFIENVAFFNVQIVSNNGAFQNAIKDLSLKDIDLSEFDHEHTETNINNATISGTTYTYPLIDLGVYDGQNNEALSVSNNGSGKIRITLKKPNIYINGAAVYLRDFTEDSYNGYYTITNVGTYTFDITTVTYVSDATGVIYSPNMYLSLTDRYPAIPVKTLCEKIARDAGYTMDINWHSSGFDGNVVMISPSDFKNDNDNLEFYRFSLDGAAFALTNADTSEEGCSLTTANFGTDILSLTSGVDGNYYELNFPSAYEDAGSGLYKLKFNIDVFASSAGGLATLDLRLIKGASTLVYAFNCVEGSNNFEYDLIIDSADTYRFDALATNFDSAAVIDCSNMNWSAFKQQEIYNELFSLSSVMPDIKQLDFLKDISKLFNAYIYVNEDLKTIEFESRKYFYADTAIDWTNKIDTSKDILIEEYPAAGIYEYLWDKEEKVLTTEGDYKSVIDNSNASTFSVKIDNFAFSFMYAHHNIGSPLPTAWDVSNVSEITTPPEKNTNIKPRLLYYSSDSRAVTSQYAFEGSLKSSMPYAYSYFDNGASTNGLHYEDRINEVGTTNEGLFNRFYTGQQDVITNSRVVTCNFILSNKDVLRFVNENYFNKPIFVNYKNIKGYYYVQSIEKYTPSKLLSSTKVTLIEAVDKDINI